MFQPQRSRRIRFTQPASRSSAAPYPPKIPPGRAALIAGSRAAVPMCGRGPAYAEPARPAVARRESGGRVGEASESNLGYPDDMSCSRGDTRCPHARLAPRNAPSDLSDSPRPRPREAPSRWTVLSPDGSAGYERHQAPRRHRSPHGASRSARPGTSAFSPGNERGSDLAHVAVLTRREVAVVAGPPAANGAELS
jgi:hypothetical protein